MARDFACLCGRPSPMSSAVLVRASFIATRKPSRARGVIARHASSEGPTGISRGGAIGGGLTVIA
jgi:hypothetical protein